MITWVFIGVTHYVLGIQSGIAYNISQVIGTGVATLFRYWAYKKWVFLPVTAPPVDPHTGLPEAEVRAGRSATRTLPAARRPPTRSRLPAGHSAAPVSPSADLRRGR